jgi:hypothetical protein
MGRPTLRFRPEPQHRIRTRNRITANNFVFKDKTIYLPCPRREPGSVGSWCAASLSLPHATGPGGKPVWWPAAGEWHHPLGQVKTAQVEPEKLNLKKE